jgi:hypothetical protein
MSSASKLKVQLQRTLSYCPNITKIKTLQKMLTQIHQTKTGLRLNKQKLKLIEHKKLRRQNVKQVKRLKENGKELLLVRVEDM